MKKILFLLLLICFCRREEKTVVTFWHVMGGPLGRTLNEMIDDFNKAHPEGEVKSVHMGSYDALAQKLMGAVASNSPPVIAQMYESWTDQFFKAGVLYPLEEFIKDDEEFNLKDFYPVFIEDNIYDSVLVTLPFNKSIPVFYYNSDLLHSHDFDSFPEDWSRFRKLCEAIREEDIWPTSWPIDVWYFSTMLYQEGGSLYDVKTRTPLFNSPEGRRVLEYMVELVKDSLLYLNPGFQRQTEFLSGNVAVIPASVVSWVFMKDQVPFTMGVAPFPRGKKDATVIAGTNIGMFKKTTAAQKKLAWEFIKWFLTPENQMRWTGASYYLPTRQSVTRLESCKKFLDENPGYGKILEQLYFAGTEPRVKEWFTGRIYLNEALEEALRLERTPQQALDFAARRFLVELK
ncbi:MAG TPA: ABC transporter substrate-binding protein [candidate division WOR-3 bacterium]|uniref:ABC transporter substrate-binding protein n=1 Tax=candidate division WOR-3 bacterium TaxID=2052148 RepID=A0A9C9ELI2_UNCW3|nr:ABC transporter substrate-binding protein [candidate division WOR-3 bacterium]